LLTANQEKWLQALESGEFKQGEGRLQEDDSYCCLGVACRVAGVQGDLKGASLTTYPDVIEAMGLTESYGCPIITFVNGQKLYSLTHMNDGLGKSFKEIAAHLRKYPEAYFVNTEPRDVA
jgi:hypothetical protein